MSWKGEPGRPGQTPEIDFGFIVTSKSWDESVAEFSRTLNEVLDKLHKEKPLKAGDMVRLRSGGPADDGGGSRGSGAVRVVPGQGKPGRQFSRGRARPGRTGLAQEGITDPRVSAGKR